MLPEFATRILRILILLGGALFAQSASATFHLWDLSELYSDASGTVQYIELSTFDGGQEFVGGHTITTSQGASIHTFNFPTDLSGGTAGHKFLIGTQGFANLGIVTPDYIVPNGFLFQNNGNVNFADVDSITYSALPTDGIHALNRNGNSVVNAPTNFAGITGSISPVQAPLLDVVEFYNTTLDHYFITADANEATQIDGGSAGPGWIRTGNSFKSGGSTTVCRFYGSQSPGPNSHFYTVDPIECDFLKQLQQSTPATQKRWNFESLDFVSSQPTTGGLDGACPTGTVPVYRAYNNGFAQGIDSNHRITSSLAAIQEVVSRGWSNEGVVMCAPN